MSNFKKAVVMVLTVGIVCTMSGCVYYENKPWNTLTEEEKQAARETLQQTRDEIEETIQPDTLPGKFADFILDGVQQGLEE